MIIYLTKQYNDAIDAFGLKTPAKYSVKQYFFSIKSNT